MFLVFLPGLLLLRSITDPLSGFASSASKMALFAVASLVLPALKLSNFLAFLGKMSIPYRLLLEHFEM